MMPLLHYQPFKALYLLYFALKLVAVDVPLWTVFSLRRSARPIRSWSITKCLHVYFLRALLRLPMRSGLSLKRDPSKEVPDRSLRNAKFVWVEGVEERVLTGEVQKWAKKSGVTPARIPGYWQFKEDRAGFKTLDASPDEKVVYHLHGGAFWIGSAHPEDPTALIPRGILDYSKTVKRTFAIEYRLSGSAPFKAENPFPAGLLDCLAGYQYLIKLGFRPQNIILTGDSAGGNLSMALVRHLLENVTGLDKPGRLLLFSPWADLSSSRNGPGSSLAENKESDYLRVEPDPSGIKTLGAYGVASYLGTEIDKEETKTNKYLSPASVHLGDKGLFAGFPRTYILAGSVEVILDDSKVIAERMKRDNEGRDDWVTLEVVPDAVHDFCVFPWHEPERGEALLAISKWIEKTEL